MAQPGLEPPGPERVKSDEPCDETPGERPGFGIGRMQLLVSDTAPTPIRPLAPRVDPRAADPIVHDPVMQQRYAMLDVFAPTPLNVLVLGETGVGKDLYAAAIHERSGRGAKPYLELNCAALPESILEGELFGYERGAFTGAVHAKPGLFESADGGTVLLDEIGELPLATQAKLLRVLESGTVLRLGSVHARRIDVRFVAATNRDLGARVAGGQFRADLYFRINGITVTLPPLRDRRADIAPLARAFVARAAAALGRQPPALAADAIAALERYPWPGNIRELKSVLERATVFCTGEVLGAAGLSLPDGLSAPHLPLDAAAPGVPATGASIGASIDASSDDPRALRRQHIIDALAQAAGNQTRAARALGISRFQLMRRLADYGVPRPRKP